MEKIQELNDKANVYRLITPLFISFLVISIVLVAVLKIIFHLPVLIIFLFMLTGFLLCLIFILVFNRILERNTKAKFLQNDLERREELFREFAETIDAVFWRASADLDKMIYVSPAYEKIWGQSRTELYNHPTAWLDAIVPQDRENAIDAFIHRIHQENVDSVQAEYRIRRPDGSIRHIYDRGFKLKDANGNAFAVMGIANDMTAYRLAQIRKRVQKDVTNIIKLLNEKLSFHEVSLKILEAIGSSLEWSEGELWFLNPNENILHRVELWINSDLDISEFDKESLPKTYQFGEGMPGKVWQKHKVVWMTNALQDADLGEYSQTINKLGLSSVIGIPVRYQNIIYGVMVFASTVPVEPDDDLIKMLTTVGEQLGAFIYMNQFSEILWREDT